MVIDNWVKLGLDSGELRYIWSFNVFWRFLWAQMTNLSPIDFSLGSSISILMLMMCKKFEVQISKHVTKIANLGAKIGQSPLLQDAL